MPSPFLPPDETHRSYHSGATGRVIEPVAAPRVFARAAPTRTFTFETGKYRPPFKVTLRTSVDWNQDHEGNFQGDRWVFELNGTQYEPGLHMKLVLDGNFWMIGNDVWVPSEQRHRHFMDHEVFFLYQVRFVTGLWQPNHLITLRTSDDGWTRDMFGVFRDPTWAFQLDRADYPASFEAKLVLDRRLFMNGPNLSITSAQPEYLLNDGSVVFADSPSAYRHGYDNFMPIESPLEQVTVRSPGGEAEHYDVIVIGSGMGGGVLADALTDRGARVLVLDAGGLWFPVHANELPGGEIDLARRDELGHFVNASGSNLYYGVHFNLGGRSVYWSGVIPRMRAWEMRDVWPETVRNYLTLPGSDGLSGYDRAERVMRRGKTLGPYQRRVRRHLRRLIGTDLEVTDLPRSLHQPNLDRFYRLRNVLKKPTGVFSTADLLLDSIGFSGRAGRTGLRINLHHLATQIEKSGNQATAVVCQDLIGNVQRRFTGQYIVLACGSLESPKLAINSGLTDPNGKMGRGLTDHPAFFYRIHHELPRTGSLGWVGDPYGHAKLLIQHRSSTPTSHAYNVEVLINAKYWDARHADDDLWRQRIDSQRISRVEAKFSFDSALDDGNEIRPRPGQKPEVFVSPNTAGDPYKSEVVTVRNRILSALGVTDPLSTTWVDSEWGQGVDGSVHHAGGTLRMSDDGSGVVDDTQQFLAYDNLYCCDVSVFPTIPAANPSLTLVALALRLANTLAVRLGL
jgi:choline dehydrogenase-like flavoprotein